MSGINGDEMTAEERLLAERVVLNFRELNQACDAAKNGMVLGVCETLAMRQGRELVRRTIESSLHVQKAEVELSPGRRSVEQVLRRGSANAD